jgi:hypothetical protein
MDPFITYDNSGDKYFKLGICPLCYFRKREVVTVGPNSTTAYKSKKAIEQVNEHLATVHASPWRYLGEQGRASLLLADVSQLAEHPEVIEEMYDTLMDGFKDDKTGMGFPSRQFESGKLTHDVQAVIVNESGGSDMGSMTFAKVVVGKGFGSVHHFQEVRVIWDDSCLRGADMDFTEFFVASSTILNIFDFSVEEIESYLDSARYEGKRADSEK